MPTPEAVANRAVVLQELHRQPGLSVLPNAWDIASARLFAELPGVSALATTSAGVAAAAGRRDGEIGKDGMLDAVARICRAVELPVSADLEAGYDDVAVTVKDAVQAGCAGINLEDGNPAAPSELLAPDRFCALITTARSVADGLGVPLVINARTDVYWRSTGDPETRFGDCVSRLRRYALAGADCVFAPGFPESGASAPGRDVHRLVDELTPTPVNLLATSATPPWHVLAEAGVRRLTIGSGLYRLAMASTRHAAKALLATGDPGELAAADALSYPVLADLLDSGG